MIPRGWWSILRPRKSPTPAFLFYVEAQQVVQHAFAIVSTKHINSVFVSHHSVLWASRTHKLVTGGHFPPSVDRLKGSKVQSETFCTLWPIGVKLCVKRPWISHVQLNPVTVTVKALLLAFTFRVGHSWGAFRWGRHGQEASSDSSSASAAKHLVHLPPDTQPEKNWVIEPL